MESLHCLKFLLEQDDLLCKIDLKETYFSVPLNKNSQKFVIFQWSGNLYLYICRCFGLGPAPRIFTKLLKVPIALMRRVNIRIIIYVDDNVEDVTRNSHNKRHIDFSTFGFCDQPQKISPVPCQTNRAPGLINRFRENDFRSFREKIKTCASTMSGTLGNLAREKLLWWTENLKLCNGRKFLQ